METPPPALNIRRARPQDAEAMAELQNLPGVRHGTLQLPHPNPDAIRKRLEAASDDRSLLAFSQDRLIGVISLHPQTGLRAHVAGLGMAVHDGWIGRGVGGMMMREVIDIAERWLGLRRLELTVYTDNVLALALYRKFNFALEGTHRAYALRDGMLVDAYTMARLLV